MAVDQLVIEVYAGRDEMGAAAACDVARRMQETQAQQEGVRIVFAAAPSQNEFLATLCAIEGLHWSGVEAFQMDEYLGLEAKAPQLFSNFLRAHLFDRVMPGRVEYLDGTADAQAECERYSALLNERPIDIVCAGIGENGHMAFNDPPVADFEDAKTLKMVTLDQVCRRQQVHDGAFPTIDDVPKVALSMTMPALMSARWLYCVVPGRNKAEAVRKTLADPISTACPATLMRRHPNAVLYLDLEAAAQV